MFGCKIEIGIYTDFAVVILSETMTEYKELEDGLKKLDTEIQQQQKLSDDPDNSTQGQFLKVMKDFQMEATEQFTKVESLCQEMCEAYDRVVRYFGENPEKMLPDEFFGIISRFRTNWQVIWIIIGYIYH